MESPELVRRNRDLHLHTCEFSDGWHGVVEVVARSLRWIEAEPWAGVSDHTPLSSEALLGRSIREEPDASWESGEALDRATARYIETAQNWGAEVSAALGATLLVGLEVDWSLDGPRVSERVVERTDYALMAYHGRRLTTAAEADSFLRRVAAYPCADIIAHPDRFLGPFDARRCDWPSLFREMADRRVAVEYNLTMPLHSEVLAQALEVPNLLLAVGSDLHDFRHAGVWRLMDAWSESVGGGFDAAFAYLAAMVSKAEGPGDERLVELFATPERLAATEGRVYACRRRHMPSTTPLDAPTLALLDRLRECGTAAEDRAFLVARMERFAGLPAERILGTLNAGDVSDTILEGRRLRRRMASGGG